MEQADLKKFALLMLALFVIAIVTALTYIGMDYLKETACEQNQDDAYTWSGGECLDNTTAVTVTAISKINIVEAVIDIALGLLALVVVVAIFKVVVKTARGFGGA